MRRINASMQQLEAAVIALHGGSVSPPLIAQVRACRRTRAGCIPTHHRRKADSL